MMTPTISPGPRIDGTPWAMSFETYTSTPSIFALSARSEISCLVSCGTSKVDFVNCTCRSIDAAPFEDTKRMSFDRSSRSDPCSSCRCWSSSFCCACSSCCWPEVICCCCGRSAPGPARAAAARPERPRWSRRRLRRPGPGLGLGLCWSSCAWAEAICCLPDSSCVFCWSICAWPSAICWRPSTIFCRCASSWSCVVKPSRTSLTPSRSAIPSRKSLTSAFWVAVKALPSVVSKTSVPLPPFADGNLSASSSCTWLVFVFGIVIDEEIVPANRL